MDDRKSGGHIHLANAPEETEIVIRVGILGDRDASIAIKEEIRKNLFKE